MRHALASHAWGHTWRTGGFNFYKLFKELDLDGNHRISFNELEILARTNLRLSKSQLNDLGLAKLWKALDVDNSGYVDTHEHESLHNSSRRHLFAREPPSRPT